MSKTSIISAFVILTGCQSGLTRVEISPYQGVVELDERVIGFEVPGRLVEVSTTKGAKVDTGAKLARLDDSLEQVAREARAADLAAAEAQLALVMKGPRKEEIRASDSELRAARATRVVVLRGIERQRQLVAQGASAAARGDELEVQLAEVNARIEMLQQKGNVLRDGARDEEEELARTRVEAARAALKLIDERLQRYSLTADSATTVLDVHVSRGELVAAGSAVVTVADLDHPYVDVFVPQNEISIAREGAPVSLHIDTLSTPLTGTVEQLGRQTEFTPRYLFSDRERSNLVVRVRVRITDPSHQLRAGVPAFVDFAPKSRS